jgi:hypothetical protein
MISAPMPRLCIAANAWSAPLPPSLRPPISCQYRVANIHSCRRSPACPNGAAAAWPSPVAKPSSEIEKLCTRNADIRALLLGRVFLVDTSMNPTIHDV